jgi:GT2 family glycosyltransferase
MIYYFTPYSTEKKLLKAIDQYMALIHDNDWACLMDGDTAFLRSDFGVRIKEYIEKYPDTGLFTFYASRCHYACQVRKGTDMMSDSILYHKQRADEVHNTLHLEVKTIDRRIAGHLMIIQKSTWNKIRPQVFRTAKDKEILGVDTKISNAIISKGMKIRLMRGIYIFHYLRMAEGFGYKEHFK